MRIALVQINSSSDTRKNLALVEEGARTAAARGARLIVFPEATSQAFGTGRLDEQAQELTGDFATAVAEVAKDLNVIIVAGMFRPADNVQREGKTIHRVFNTALITGESLHRGYDKIHTYDAHHYAESDTVKPGSDLVTFEHDGVTIGVATCFDIRFPQQFQDLARRGAQVIVVPTSWANGEHKLAQWRTLATARALDAGVFIAGAGQALPFKDTQGPTGIGHSLVVDPNGVVLEEAGDDPDILVVDVDPGLSAQVRADVPIL